MDWYCTVMFITYCFSPALLDSEPRTSYVLDTAIALNCIHFSFLSQLNFGTGSHQVVYISLKLAL